MSGPFEFEIMPLGGATASEFELEAPFGELETEFEMGEFGELEEFKEFESGVPIGEFEMASAGEFETGLGDTGFGEFEAFELEAPVAWEAGTTLPECPPKPQPVDCPKPGTQPTVIIDNFDFESIGFEIRLSRSAD